jgi:ectoine hydroxylase-related dioxygenase (phytanoyl-CoA dioxygenase family)
MDGGPAADQERRGYNEVAGQSAKADAGNTAPNQRVFLLQNKGDVFLELLENPIFKDVVDYYLDDEFTQVAQYSANIVGAGGEPMYLHQDQNSVQPITPFPMGVNTAVLLDDFTEANGATRLIPGSHIAHRGLAPDNIYSIEGTIAVEAPAGSAIIWDSRLWHGTGASQPGQAPRRSIIILSYLPWARPHNNGVLSTHPSVYDKMSYELKTKFGYRVTNGQGSLMVEPEGTIVKWDPDYLIKELRL